MARLDISKFVQSSSNYFYTFADFPEAKVYSSETSTKWVQHLLFGDYIQILDLEITNNRVKVKARNNIGWISINNIQKERVLEVNFIDIGQGDGCHVVTPDDKHFVIDAGAGDNMNRYITWRFNLYKKNQPIDLNFNAIISHGDLDHYGGFRDLFKNKALRFSNVYHQGIVERPEGGKASFGKIEDGLIVDLVKNTADMKAILTDPTKLTGKGSTYPKTLSEVLKSNPQVAFKMLNIEDDYLDGYGNQNKVNEKEFSFKILGPIPQTKNGKKGLKSIDKGGKDKNGHSVILKLKYGNLKLLLGGDLNEEFGKIMYKHYDDNNKLDELVVDAAKACHHGSNHFDLDFLKAVNAAVTVISSGDDEPYSHPRPDTLGALGKHGYGERPMIFSTELARSNKEITYKNLVNLNDWGKKVGDAKLERKAVNDGNAPNKADLLKAIDEKIINIQKDINSFLTRFGMINLRSDGNRMIIAQKYERDAPTGKWDIQEMTFDAGTGRFERKS
jgi:beta-lactamase superfamily II metal-dependent hydrolase